MERHQPAAQRPVAPHPGARSELRQPSCTGGDAGADRRRQQPARHLLLPALAAPAARCAAVGGDPGGAAGRRLAAVPGTAGVRGGSDRHPGEAAQPRRALPRPPARGGGQSARLRGGAPGRDRGPQGARRPGACAAPDEFADRRAGAARQGRLQPGHPGVADGERGDGDRHRADARLGRRAGAARRDDHRHRVLAVQLPEPDVLAVRGPGTPDGRAAEGGRQPGAHSAAVRRPRLAAGRHPPHVSAAPGRHRLRERQLPLSRR